MADAYVREVRSTGFQGCVAVIPSSLLLPLISPSSIGLYLALHAMGSPFCRVNIEPHRPRPLDHDDKFSTFITWARQTLEGSELVVDDSIIPSAEGKPYAVQLV